MNAAVIDVNLGLGPSSETAHALQSANMPFLFVTGYDQSSIPAEFGPIPRVAKPTNAGQIVRVLCIC
jgi:hypothetical protein